MADYDFPKNTEFEILCALVREPERFANIIEAELFTYPISLDIARVVGNNREKHPKDKISRSTLVTLLKSDFASQRKRGDGLSNALRHVKKIFHHEFDNLDTLEDVARKWVTVRRWRKFLVDSEQDINAGHSEHIPKRLAKMQASLAQKDSRIFHRFADFHNAPPLTFSIDGFLQNYAATLIGGLSGHGKTWVMLSMAKALLSGEKLWGYFEVPKKARRVLYLIPESSIMSFKPRLKKMGLYKYVKDHRLLVHTLSAGPKPKLDDPRLLAKANHSHIFLDTAVRFGEGSENDARENQQLAENIFALLSAGAKTVTGAHHSAKGFEKERYMTLENLLRGTGDIGAVPATVWGVRQIDEPKNILYMQNVKPRDFEACGPFLIQGRPWIDQRKHFRMIKRPGSCGMLDVELPRRGGGAPPEQREAKNKNKEAVRQLMRNKPTMSSKVIAKKLHLEYATVRGYKSQINAEVL